MLASAQPVFNPFESLASASRMLTRFSVLTLEDAKSALNRFKSHENVNSAIYNLKGVTTLFNLHSALREIGIDQDEELTRLLYTRDDEGYVGRAMTLLSKDIALDVDWMEQDYMDTDEGRIYLRPELLGINSMWDEEFQEAFDTPEDVFDVENRLVPFFTCLNLGFDGETWEACNKYFGWRIPEPLKVEGNIDFEKFERVMADLGYGDFLAAFEVGCGGNNLFFTNDINSDPFELTLENVEYLRREYAEAKEILKISAACTKKVKHNRGILREIMIAWHGCAVERQRVRV
jgi:hypothetical protein